MGTGPRSCPGRPCLTSPVFSFSPMAAWENTETHGAGAYKYNWGLKFSQYNGASIYSIQFSFPKNWEELSFCAVSFFSALFARNTWYDFVFDNHLFKWLHSFYPADVPDRSQCKECVRELKVMYHLALIWTGASCTWPGKGPLGRFKKLWLMRSFRER
jgi:hypothetical protein